MSFILLASINDIADEFESIYQKQVMSTLAGAANDKGECFMLISTIEHRCRCSRSKVKRTIAELIKLGFLSRTLRTRQDSKMNRSSSFQINIKKVYESTFAAKKDDWFPNMKKSDVVEELSSLSTKVGFMDGGS